MPDQPRVTAHASALAAGLTESYIRHHLARGLWKRLHRGVYFTVGREPTESDRMLGAVLFAGNGAALSGAAVLRCWDIRGVSEPVRPLVLVPASSGAAATAAILVRRTEVPFTVKAIRGIAAVEVARAVADHCVQVRRLDTVQSIVSEVVRRNLCSADSLVGAAQAGPRRGSANLRIAVEDATFGAWSVPEAIIGRALRAARVLPFTQNTRVYSERGRLLAKVDVWWASIRAALEIHGAEHHSSPKDWAETVRRTTRLEQNGIAVLQIPAVDVLRNLDDVARQAAEWLGRQALRR
ncbi:MAG: hypothetical protein JWN20_43 [Jatrophihabitantaceae bacterium]|nr:hypothetical protein [Jatrophihabitantaceae bacterium]